MAWLWIFWALTPQDPSAAVRRADLDLCRAVVQKDPARFKSLVAPDARFFSRQGVVVGPEAVYGEWSEFFTPGSTVAVAWGPTSVEVSANLAYTIGEAIFRVQDPKAGVQFTRTTYVTIWRREKDGAWRASVDLPAGPKASADEAAWQTLVKVCQG